MNTKERHTIVKSLNILVDDICSVYDGMLIHCHNRYVGNILVDDIIEGVFKKFPLNNPVVPGYIQEYVYSEFNKILLDYGFISLGEEMYPREIFDYKLRLSKISSEDAIINPEFYTFIKKVLLYIEIPDSVSVVFGVENKINGIRINVTDFLLDIKSDNNDYITIRSALIEYMRKRTMIPLMY